MEVHEKFNKTEFKVLSTNILPPTLKESIDKIAKREGYKTHKIRSRAISTNGGNYLAELYEVDIKGKIVDGEKETNIFIKNKMGNLEIKILDIGRCYSTENLFYGELSILYDDMQKKANVPVEERYAIVKSYDATNPDAIILENLAKKGFGTIHRMEVISLKFAELSIQQLARFHALSWALEKQYPEYYEKKIKNMKTTIQFGDDYQSFVENMSKYTHKCADEKQRPALKKLKSRTMQTLKRYYFENAGVRCCLCHGDYRTSNILVRKDDNISYTVDYQMLHYGCPVMDFIHFIFLATDQDFRRNYLDNLKDLYHDSLAKFLKYFDMDVETVYPRHEFEAQFKERLDFGLIMSLMVMPLQYTVDDDAPDIMKQNLGVVTQDPRMGGIIRGIVDDFQRWGIL